MRIEHKIIISFDIDRESKDLEIKDTLKIIRRIESKVSTLLIDEFPKITNTNVKYH